MAQAKPPYIIFYLDDLDALEPFSDAERGRLLTSLLQYGRTGAAEGLSGNERFLFPMLRARIDRDFQAYEEKCNQNAENGKKGGAPIGNKNATKKKRNAPETTETTEAVRNKPKQPNACKTTETSQEEVEAEEIYSRHRRLSAPARASDMPHPASAEGTAADSPEQSEVVSAAMLAAASVGMPEPDPRVDPELGKVMSFYLNRINSTPSNMSIEILGEFAKVMESGVIIRAMEHAIDEHKPIWSYIHGTLKAYKAKGIRTLEDWQRSEDEHDREKNQRREDMRNASNRRNYQGHGDGTPPSDPDPLRGFTTECPW